jgi:GH24 family phage-related lysozyme (muramidase)
MGKVVMVSERGIDLTMGCGKFESRPYLCPAGIWTQGFGNVRNMDTGEFIKRDSGAIDYKTGRRWLTERYRLEYCPALNLLLRDDLKQHEYDAVANFMFFTGGYYLDKKSGSRWPYRLIALINNKVSAEELRAYWLKCGVTVGGKVMKSLEQMRVKEVEMFLGG